MSAVPPECRATRLAIGAAPRALPPDAAAHVAGCAACRRFLDETLALDARVHAALELPLERFRTPAPPARRFALAASVVLALLVAGGAWLLRPQPALAAEVLDHVRHEAGSWDERRIVPASAVADVLAAAGVRFDSSLPVVYAMACDFHGHAIPHFVVQAADGPLTVMLLPHEHVATRTEFAESGLQGVLLPAGEGAVAVLARAGEVPDAVADSVVSGVRWR